MKIAITDFDGTLAPFNERIPLATIKAIQYWRAAGNKFGIATGRGFNMLMHDLRNYDITTDFLICVNGAVVFDKDKQILNSIRINSDLKSKFIELPLIKNSTYAMVCFCEREVFSIRPYPEMPLDVAPEIKLIDVLNRDDVVQFGIRFDTIEDAADARNVIENELPQLGGNPNRIFLDVNVKSVDKKFGIDTLLDKMNWRGHELFVIGDDKNDLPMITAFNGYTVNRAADFMHAAARKVYESVGDMLLDNL